MNTKLFRLDFNLLILGLENIWICFGLNYFFLLFEENTINAEARSFCLKKGEQCIQCVYFYSQSLRSEFIESKTKLAIQ